MITMDRNCSEVYADTEELAKALEFIAEDVGLSKGYAYYMKESADHMRAMYLDLCVLESRAHGE